MSPSDQLPPRRRGTSCLGKVSRKTASRHMNECTRFRCPICTVIIVGTEYRVERTRAGDSLRRDDPSRARRATTTPRQETHDSSGGGDGSGDDGHVFFSLSKFHLGGGGVPRGSWKKRGAGRTTRSPRRAQGVAGWLGSGCADPERCNCPNERPSHDDDENPSVWLSETNATGGRDSR